MSERKSMTGRKSMLLRVSSVDPDTGKESNSTYELAVTDIGRFVPAREYRYGHQEIVDAKGTKKHVCDGIGRIPAHLESYPDIFELERLVNIPANKTLLNAPVGPWMNFQGVYIARVYGGSGTPLFSMTRATKCSPLKVVHS